MPALPPNPLPTMPSNCVARAGTHLRMVSLGISDMEAAEQDRVILGFFNVAIYGRSVSLALEHLTHWDPDAFLEWYAPWKDEMSADPLCRFFYKLRTGVIHQIDPLIGYVLAAVGPNAPQVGTIRIPDDEAPTEHRGQPINDRSAINLCRLYLAFLQEMFNSILDMVWKLDDRVWAEYVAKLPPGTIPFVSPPS